jgi:excisionase family DNA binding protein
MSVMATGPTRAVAESIRLQIGTDALVLITPGPHSCAVVIASVPGYPSRLTDARTELDSESVKAGDGERIAYSVLQAARALGLSKGIIYDQLRSLRLGSVKVGNRRIITRQQIDAWLADLPSEPPEP